MQDTLIVSGGAAGRLSTWGISTGDASPYDALLKGLVFADTCAAVPLLLGSQLIKDQQSSPALSPDLALYAGTNVLRKLGVYNGSLVEVKNPRSCYIIAAEALGYGIFPTLAPSSLGPLAQICGCLMHCDWLEDRLLSVHWGILDHQARQ